jgi:photosystem II stability/assembly factor-like uncharacterized protein
MNISFTILSVLLLCVSITSHAQQIDINKYFKNMKPRSVGPSGMSGRITAIDALWQNPNIIYLGAASGGVWKTENSGNSWKPVFDEQPIQNIGSIAIQQSNPSVVWVGTGEGNPRNSVNIGEGIYKSLDGGNTWKCMGLEKTRNIHRVIIDPNNPDVVYAGAIGNPYGVHKERGIYKTTDGGTTWKQILYTNDSSGIADMVMDPKNPNKIVAAMWQHHRTPWSFTSGGKGSGLYVTYDAGNTWKKLGQPEGLPTGNYGRIGLAICRNMPNRIYALIESTKSGLYKSDDGGLKWELVNSNPEYVANRSFYFQEIFADPLNENRLWLINQVIQMSEDGGKTFKGIVPYSGIHPDHHAFWIHPTDNNFIIEGNDGGIGITKDMGKHWTFDEKLPVGQFYHINVDNELPYHVMGGMQDNGSWRGPGYTWVNGPIKNHDWESLWGGDGFDVMPDAEDANWVYAMSQGGNLGKYNTQTGEDWFIKPPSVVSINDTVRLRFNWNAGIAQDPFNKKTIYYGSQFVHKSTDKGASWKTISTDLTSNDSIKQDQSKNGGISIDITGAENHCTILSIEPSKKQQGVIWVTTDDGYVQLTTNGGKTWQNVTNNIKDLPKHSWLPQIKASPYNAGEAILIANNYRRGDFTPYAYRTLDYGKTWQRFIDATKVKGYTLCALQDPVEPNLLFIGTEQGLFISFDNGNSFQQFKNGYPSVSTFDLAIQERESDLCIGTFGRAIYILDDIKPLRALAANKGMLSKKLQLFLPNEVYQANQKNVSGYAYSTWGTWEGQNKLKGAGINYFVHKPAAKDSAAKKIGNIDTAMVSIYNSNNLLIRNIKWPVDSGFNKRNWNLEENGIRMPGTPKPKPTDAIPPGAAVMPGQYKIVVSYLDAKDSTTILVKNDPRIVDNNSIRKAQQEKLNTLKAKVEKLTTGMDYLQDAEDIIKKMEAQWKDVDNKNIDSLKKEHKKINEQIKTIREFVSGKKVERQGYGKLPETTVMTCIQEAFMYVRSKNMIPGIQEEQLLLKAHNNVEEAIQQINKFTSTTWKAYQQKVEQTPISIFKDMKPL